MNYESLKHAVLAVEENNHINNGKWTDWEDAHAILETYGISQDDDVRAVLQKAIESNGYSLPADLRAAELIECGQNFGAAGFRHPGSAASADAYWIDRIEARYD